ncbi:hypothetical protein SK128_013036 [Halocaridina rubra]|uniref:Uncharacterized protein n=1 Tax=Halocaridina rubra TaxID=373956 RepID=A0AAN8WNI8_HALRR
MTIVRCATLKKEKTSGAKPIGINWHLLSIIIHEQLSATYQTFERPLTTSREVTNLMITCRQRAPTCLNSRPRLRDSTWYKDYNLCLERTPILQYNKWENK